MELKMLILSPEKEYKGKSFPLVSLEYKLKECTTRTKRNRRGEKAYLVYLQADPLVEQTIAADSRFYWLDNPAEPKANDFGKLTSYLASNGYDIADVRKSMGSSLGDRDRGKLVEDMKEYVQKCFK